MRNILSCLIILISVHAYAQETLAKTLVTRANELHKAIGSGEKTVWKKYVVENYSQALIDKPMRRRISNNEETEEKSTTAVTQEEKLDEKAGMFERLHDDFGDSILEAIKVTGETAVMTLKSASGLTGLITIKADKEKPFLLSAFNVEAHN